MIDSLDIYQINEGLSFDNLNKIMCSFGYVKNEHLSLLEYCFNMLSIKNQRCGK